MGLSGHFSRHGVLFSRRRFLLPCFIPPLSPEKGTVYVVRVRAAQTTQPELIKDLIELPAISPCGAEGDGVYPNGWRHVQPWSAPFVGGGRSTVIQIPTWY